MSDKSERELAKERYEGQSYKELAGVFQALTQAKKDLKSELAVIEERLEALTIDVIPDKLAEDGMKNVTLADIGRWQVSPQAYCSTRAGMGPAVQDWMREHGFEDIISEVINASTLKAFIKEQLELGNDVPGDDLVNYEPYLKASLVKA